MPQISIHGMTPLSFPSLVQVAIINYHRLGGFKDKLTFLRVLYSVKSKMKALGGLGLLPGLQMAILYPHMAENREGKQTFKCCFLVFFFETEFRSPYPGWSSMA